jgi:hypothetical protein
MPAGPVPERAARRRHLGRSGEFRPLKWRGLPPPPGSKKRARAFAELRAWVRAHWPAERAEAFVRELDAREHQPDLWGDWRRPATTAPLDDPRQLALLPSAYLEKIPAVPPSPAGEGELGSSGSGAQSARAVREAPPGGRLREGGQLDLPVRARAAVPAEQEVCAYCDRRGFMRVKTDGMSEVRCSMHLGGPSARLPADVRRASR